VPGKWQRSCDQAAEQFRKALQIDPNHALLRHNLGELYLAQGHWAHAVQELERSVAASAEPSSHYQAMLGVAYARAQRKQDAVTILNELERRSSRDLVSAFDMASPYAALSENERALVLLEEGNDRLTRA
jgi:predicted Zn-dependent protease